MYPTIIERVLATEDYKKVVKAEQLVYLLTLVLLSAWKELPTYQTLFTLRKRFVTEPKNNPVLNEFRQVFAETFTVADIYTASAEAFYEFRERIGKLYQVLKVMENSDLDEYKDALKLIDNQIEELKARKTNLILPGVK